eukprot:m.76503 g.76503  ORF g.76503 m.76503 type:complete len:312 (-) comp12486_c0_seq8:295-1230(-)
MVERDDWVHCVKETQAVLGGITRPKSSLSIASMASMASVASNASGGANFKFADKFHEATVLMEEFCKHLSALESGTPSEIARAATLLKHTGASWHTAMSQCSQLMSGREERCKRRVARYTARCKRAEELAMHAKQKLKQKQAGDLDEMMIGPDYVEGPHSRLPEAVFQDAVRAGLDDIEAESDRAQQILKLQQQDIGSAAAQTQAAHAVDGAEDDDDGDDVGEVASASPYSGDADAFVPAPPATHRLAQDVEAQVRTRVRVTTGDGEALVNAFFSLLVWITTTTSSTAVHANPCCMLSSSCKIRFNWQGSH